MKRDFTLAALTLAAACVAGTWVRSIDWQAIWIYDVGPWLTWDGKPAPEPSGEGWSVKRHGN